MKNQFLQPKGVKNVSNMSQPIRHIIINDQKHILDLYKWHKDHLEKKHPPLKNIPNCWKLSLNKISFMDMPYIMDSASNRLCMAFPIVLEWSTK